jgi:hypothetical protein
MKAGKTGVDVKTQMSQGLLNAVDGFAILLLPGEVIP